MATEKNIPEIRFKGFLENWDELKVYDILIERNIQSPKNDIYPLMAFVAYEGVAPKGERYNRECLVNDELNKKYKQTEFGDFIYSSNNLETGSIGLNNYGNATISPVYSIFKPTERAFSDFVGRLLIRKSFINQMVRWRQGVVYGQWRIHESDFFQIDIFVPDINEQKKIGVFLKNLDSLISLHQRKYDKLLTVKKAMLEKMFPKEGADVPEIRFKGFEGKWEKKELGKIVKITMGQSPLGENYTNNEDDHILVQGNADLKNGHVLPRIWTKQITKTGEVNDLIFTVRAPVGEVGKTAFNVVIGRGVAAIKGNEFIFQSLKKMHENGYWKKYSAGSTFDSINSNDLANALILITNEAEQTKIGTFFQNLDTLITQHQKQLEKLKNIKKACLEKMFV